MKKFLWKLAILVLIVGVPVGGINYLYKNSFFVPRNVPEQIQVMNVGSSHAYYGLYYPVLDGKARCFNFALSGQVPAYDARVLKMYEANLEAGGVCLIPVSWFSFVWKEEDAAGFEAKNSRYYVLLDRKYIKHYSLEDDLRFKLIPVAFAGEEILSHDWFPEKDLHGFAEQDRGERWYGNAEELDLEEDARLAYKGQVLDWNNVVLEEAVEALYQMIELCRQKSVTPVLVTFPFTDEFNNCADENLDIAFYDVLQEVTEKTNVKWYDYSEDSRFIYDKSLFMDSNHLNYQGAKKFTDILWEEVIKKIYYEQ